MRILLIGPVHKEKAFLKQKGKRPFLEGQGQQGWVEALRRLGHRVFVFRYTDSILVPNMVRIYVGEILTNYFPRLKSRAQRFFDTFYYLSLENWLKNKKLMDIANNVKPELLLISGGVWFLFPKTVINIKKNHRCNVVLLSGINPLTSSTRTEKEMVKNGDIDIVVDNDRGYAKAWEKLGAKKVIVLPISSVDRKLHRKVVLTKRELEEYSCDVCFVGTLTRKRQKKLEKLHYHDLKVWGDILPTIGLSKTLKPFYRGKADGEKMVKIFNAAKIVLNFQPLGMTHGGNMRTFEIPGCGALQLVDRVEAEWFIDGKEVIVFKSIEDLKRKIRYFLKNEDERKKVAEAGYKRAHKEHPYEKHFSTLIQLCN